MTNFRNFTNTQVIAAWQRQRDNGGEVITPTVTWTQTSETSTTVTGTFDIDYNGTTPTQIDVEIPASTTGVIDLLPYGEGTTPEITFEGLTPNDVFYIIGTINGAQSIIGITATTGSLIIETAEDFYDYFGETLGTPFRLKLLNRDVDRWVDIWAGTDGNFAYGARHNSVAPDLELTAETINGGVQIKSINPTQVGNGRVYLQSYSPPAGPYTRWNTNPSSDGIIIIDVVNNDIKIRYTSTQLTSFAPTRPSDIRRTSDIYDTDVAEYEVEWI